MSKHAKTPDARRRRFIAAAWIVVAAMSAGIVGTSVALAATPAAHTATKGSVAPETLSDLKGVVGEFNGTTCAQVFPSVSYSVSLVTTGGDSPYCQVALAHHFGGAVTTATSYGAGAFTVVVQGATYPDLDFQIWNANVNMTGQLGAGYVSFITAKPTS